MNLIALSEFLAPGTVEASHEDHLVSPECWIGGESKLDRALDLGRPTDPSPQLLLPVVGI